MRRSILHTTLCRALVAVLLTLHAGAALHFSLVEHVIGVDGRLMHGAPTHTAQTLADPAQADLTPLEAPCPIADLQRQGTKLPLLAASLATVTSTYATPPTPRTHVFIDRVVYRLAPKSSPPV